VKRKATQAKSQIISQGSKVPSKRPNRTAETASIAPTSVMRGKARSRCLTAIGESIQLNSDDGDNAAPAAAASIDFAAQLCQSLIFGQTGCSRRRSLSLAR
jgi:hypothetical protein